VAALHAFGETHRHVVAQVIEAELAVGTEGDVGVVGDATLVGLHVGLDDADLESQEAVDAAHPVGVAAGQVVVDRDEVGAPAGERVQVHRQDGHEGLTLACLHLGDVAVVQHDAAHELHVEGPQPSTRLEASRTTANAS